MDRVENERVIGPNIFSCKTNLKRLSARMRVEGCVEWEEARGNIMGVIHKVGKQLIH